jgi:hypothetical protein
MHSYAVEDSQRRWVTIVIGFVSVFLALGLSRLTKALQWEIPWWVDAPSVVGFFSILMVLFDRVLWRWSPVRQCGISTTPLLAGTWLAEITSSYDGHVTKREGRVYIRQTWTQILITLKTDDSSSDSIAACISASGQFPHIWYGYRNSPLSHAVATMQAHPGASEMELVSADRLEGEYFSGRGRKNHGRIVFQRTGS